MYRLAVLIETCNVLDFLTSQLMAARLIFLRKQKQKHELEDNLLDVSGTLIDLIVVYNKSL